MTLSDLRAYTESLGIADIVYQAKLPGDARRAIGVYDSKHSHAYTTAIGGEALSSYGTRWVTFLVHWTENSRDTEDAAARLWRALRDTREVQAGNTRIKFIQLLTNEPVDIGTDDAHVWERVIEAAVIYAKER